MTALRHPVTGATVDDADMSEARLAKLTRLGYRPVTAGGSAPAKKASATKAAAKPKKAAAKKVTAVTRNS